MTAFTLTHDELLVCLDALQYFDSSFVHQLKILPQHFQSVVANQKRAEVLFNDRNYQAGEIILLCEYDSNLKLYSGRFVVVRITHVLTDSGYLLSGFVMISFTPYQYLNDDGNLPVSSLLAGQ